MIKPGGGRPGKNLGGKHEINIVYIFFIFISFQFYFTKTLCPSQIQVHFPNYDSQWFSTLLF